MEREYRPPQQKTGLQIRSAADLTRALIILIIGIIMLLGDRFGIKALTEMLQSRDSFIRYLFGGLCIFYGGFRLYRVLKRTN